MRPDAYERADAYRARGMDPESANALTDGSLGKGWASEVYLREPRLWDEGGPGAEVEPVPAWTKDGFGMLSATSEEWDAVEAACRPWKAGFLDAMRGEARRSTDATYTAGYDARIREGR